MSNPIKYSDLFQDDGGIDALIKKINDLEKVYENLSKSITNQIKNVQSESKNINLTDSESIKRVAELEKQVESLTKKLKENKTARNDIAKLKERSTRLTSIEAEVEQSLKIKIQEQTKELKNSIQMVKLKEGSLKKLELALKRNIEAYGLLSPAERNSETLGKKLAATIRQQREERKTLNLVLKEEKQKIGELERSQNKLNQLQKDEAKSIAALKVEIQNKNKELKQEAILTSSSAGAYQKMSTKLNILRTRYKNLAVVGKENTTTAKKLKVEIDALDKKLKEVDKTVGQSQRNVGNYGSAWDRVKASLSTGLGALGIATGITGIVRAVGNAINIFKDFEQANSNLKAVLGATEDQMASLEQQAKDLGATTVFTASQVTQLQTEFARLGFPVDDIQNMTESTLSAASALKSGLGEQAKLTGAILKQYTLDSFQASRVNDVLAKAAASSALDFSKLAVQFPIVGATANAAGVSLERTTALLGVLSDRGLEASRSSTALRNIFLELSKQGLTYEEALEKINKASDRNAVALELFGKRGATAGLILADTTKQVNELEGSLIGSAGAAEEMAKIQRDNLAGSLKLLNSAWEGFILNLENGKGSFSELLKIMVLVATEILSIATGTQKAAEDLDDYERKIRSAANGILRLGKVLGALIITFVAYKATLLATTIRTKLLDSATKLATISFKAFDKATKANIFGLMASLLVALASSIALFKKETEKATKAQRDFNDEAERAALAIKSIESRYAILGSLSRNQLVALKRDLEEQIRLDEERAVQLKVRAEEIEKNKIAIQEASKAQSEAAKQRINEINAEIDAIRKVVPINKDQAIRQQQVIDEYIKERKEKEELLRITQRLEGFDLRQLDSTLEQIKENEERVRQINILLDKLGTAGGDDKAKGLLEKNTKALRDAKEELEKAEDLDTLISKQEEIIDLERKRKELLGETVKEQKKIREEANKDLESQTKQLREDEIVSEIKDQEEKELKLQEIKEKNRLDELKLSKADAKTKAELETEILEKGERDRAAIRKKFAQEEAQRYKEHQDFVVNEAFAALARIQAEEERKLERKIAFNERSIERQEQRANEGLENTLAFEEAERAKLEIKKLEADRKAIRLEKIKALYSAYSAAASAGDDQAIIKVVRDFAILQGLEAFGEGTGKYGTIEEAIDARTGGSSKGNSLSNGVFTGKKHDAKGGGGIPVLVEGGEGILSSEQMKAFGKDNFMKLTQSLDAGVLGSDVFGKQLALVPQKNVLNVNLGGLESKLDKVQRAIENQPKQEVNVESLSKTYTDFIDIRTTGNKKVISRYRVNKRRL